MVTKFRWIAAAIILLLLALSTAAQAQTASGLPSPCLGDAPNVYLIIDGTRRHIVDWDTFLSLGYLSPDIIPCGETASYPLGEPITRLFKGSEPPVYWLRDGVRHHIPDMETFTSLGFHASDITQLPDEVLALWSLGAPLPSVSPADAIYSESSIGVYTIRLWHPGHGLTDFATISAPDQPEIRINDVDSLGDLPSSSVTGDGTPDIEFLIRANPGSAHCCWGTIVYELGTAATEVLEVYSPADQLASTGRGDFRDLNGDGRYEFILQDPLTGIACSQPTVTAILEYDPTEGQYVGASPSFASYYDDLIAQFTAQAASGAPCDVYPLIVTLLYAGRTADAHTAFDSVYHGADAATFWATLLTAAESGRFYMPGS